MRELQAIRGPACFEINAKRRRTHGRMSLVRRRGSPRSVIWLGSNEARRKSLAKGPPSLLLAHRTAFDRGFVAPEDGHFLGAISGEGDVWAGFLVKQRGLDGEHATQAPG